MNDDHDNSHFTSADTPLPQHPGEEESIISSVKSEKQGDDSYEDTYGNSPISAGMSVPHHVAEGEPRISFVQSTEAGDDTQKDICTVSARLGKSPDRWETLRLSLFGLIGSGTFGTVNAAKVHNTNEIVAIKKVLVRKAPKTQELNILRKLHHCNIVELKFFFYTRNEISELFLSLIMEFLPYSLERVIFFQVISTMEVKLYSFQMFRALAYLHSSNICHMDLKPENILVDPTNAILKLCDFGSAKLLVTRVPNYPHVCTVSYRAPELLFGNRHFTCKVDVWSAGCILAEMFIRKRLFRGSRRSTVILDILWTIGAPTVEDARELKSNFANPFFSPIPQRPLSSVLGADPPQEAVDLISSVLKYRPSARLNMLPALAHSFYDELRQPGARLPSKLPLPPLFNFTPQELAGCPHLSEVLVPFHHRQPGTSQPRAYDDGQAQPLISDNDQPDHYGSN